MKNKTLPNYIPEPSEAIELYVSQLKKLRPKSDFSCEEIRVSHGTYLYPITDNLTGKTVQTYGLLDLPVGETETLEALSKLLVKLFPAE